VAGSCGRGNETSGSIRRKKILDYQPLIEDSVQIIIHYYTENKNDSSSPLGTCTLSMLMFWIARIILQFVTLVSLVYANMGQTELYVTISYITVHCTQAFVTSALSVYTVCSVSMHEIHCRNQYLRHKSCQICQYLIIV
jgi:hypothetical protein